MSKVPKHEISSGNVFRDLGLPDADELKAKADLAFEISRTIDGRGLSQREAARVLGIDQPKVSALMSGRLTGFSMERLYRLLNALGKDVEIVVRARREPGVHVRASGRIRSVAKAGKRPTRARTKA